MYEKLKNDPNNFSGTITVEIDGQLAYSKQIKDGLSSRGELISGRLSVPAGGVPGPVYNPNLRCTVRNVHNCVAYNIEGMNWIQYSFCLISAPVCYAEQWASCSWEVCHNHMQYTNPN